MKISTTTIQTSEVKSLPIPEYIYIMLHSAEQCEEAQKNGFTIFYRDYDGYHHIPYIRVRRSDIMKINQ